MHPSKCKHKYNTKLSIFITSARTVTIGAGEIDVHVQVLVVRSSARIWLRHFVATESRAWICWLKIILAEIKCRFILHEIRV